MCTINVSLVFKLVKLLKMWTSVTYTLFSLHCILPTEIEKLWIKRITQWIFLSGYRAVRVCHQKPCWLLHDWEHYFSSRWLNVERGMSEMRIH